MKLQIRSDLYSTGRRQDYGKVGNIQLDSKIISENKNKMITLSMKRNKSQEVVSPVKKKKNSYKEKKDFSKMSASDILKEIDYILKTY